MKKSIIDLTLCVKLIYLLDTNIKNSLVTRKLCDEKTLLIGVV